MQKMNEANLLKIHKKAAICRAFEEEVFDLVQKKIIKIPVYLSAGQEYISATIAVFLDEWHHLLQKQTFIQQRSFCLLKFCDIDKLILGTFR